MTLITPNLKANPFVNLIQANVVIVVVAVVVVVVDVALTQSLKLQLFPLAKKSVKINSYRHLHIYHTNFCPHHFENCARK